MGEYWKEVKNRWNNMAEGNWEQAIDFNPAQRRPTETNRPDSELLNQQVILDEGTRKAWAFNLKQTLPLQMSLQRQDGPDMTIYVLSDREFANFEKGRQFYPTIKLNYDDHIRFELPYGKHHIVAYLPRIRDGYSDRSVALLRVDVLT